MLIASWLQDASSLASYIVRDSSIARKHKCSQKPLKTFCQIVIWPFLAAREYGKASILVGYITASNKTGEWKLYATVPATARPCKLRFYPSSNKESTLKGTKKNITDILGKLIWYWCAEGLTTQRQPQKPVIV